MEKFAVAIFDGLNQSDAYRVGYNTKNMKSQTIWNESSKLMNHPRVIARIAELKEAVEVALVEQNVWDRLKFIDECETNLRMGRYLGQIAPANGALQMIGKSNGLLAESPRELDIRITKVTVVLPPSNDGEVPHTETKVIKGAYEMLTEADDTDGGLSGE